MTERDDTKENSYWGDERCEDAVYSVYLRKVRYHHATKLHNSSDSDDDISHLAWETVRVKLLKAGTLECLVHALGYCWVNGNDDTDATYSAVFLSTFRAFTTPSDLMDLIENRYAQLFSDNSDQTAYDQKRSFRVCLMLWLNSYSYDFDQPPDFQLLRRLMAVCSRFAPETAELRLMAQYRLDKLMADNSAARSVPSLSVGETQPGSTALTFATINERRFARQLTRMDAELFRRVIPYQCLGSTWSKRKGVDASSVAATVDQFNAVSYCVISTLLADIALRPTSRVKLLAKWMDIAQELRLLKNFSSLKAIIAGLQSSSVFRLKQTWSLLGRQKLETFEELAQIFSDDNNMFNQRQLLRKEGTAKHADMPRESDKILLKWRSLIGGNNSEHTVDKDRTVSLGTIPYLGTFLTDLMFLHMALPDHTADGLINFDKRRKEFEILAQIRLLQGACSAYSFEPDPEFESWFDSVIVLEDAEAHQLSCQAEPQTPSVVQTASYGDSVSCSSASSAAAVGGGAGGHSSVNSSGRSAKSFGSKMKEHTKRFGHRKNDSTTSVSSSSSSVDQLSSSASQEMVDRGGSGRNQRDVSMNSLETQVKTMSTGSACSLTSVGTPGNCSAESRSSVSSNRLSIRPTLSITTPVSIEATPTSADATPTSLVATPPSPLIKQSVALSNSSPYIQNNYYIIRVSMRSSTEEVQGVNLYKSIMLTNSQKTSDVIRTAMQKHDLVGTPDDYVLLQLLPDGECMIPPNVNVYYAINTSHDLNFVLAPRSGPNSGDGQKSESSTRARNLGAFLRRARLFS